MDAPDRIWVKWPNSESCGLAFTVPANPGLVLRGKASARAPYIRPDSPTALAAACLALVARARTDEAMTDQEGRLADALSVIEDKLRDVKGERG